jgi:hypothetical protein
LRLGSRVSRCDDCGAVLDNERIDSRALIWAGGLASLTGGPAGSATSRGMAAECQSHPI